MATYAAGMEQGSLIQFPSRISARAVLAGFVFGAALFLLCAVLGAAIFLSGYSPSAGSGKGLMIGFGIWSIVFFAVSALFGAWIAASTSRSLARRDGIVHGLIVWALLSLGAAGLVGSAVRGTLATAFSFGKTAAVAASQSPAVNRQAQSPDVQQQAGQAIEQAKQAVNPTEIANTAANVGGMSMWAFFVVLALSMIAALFGGWAGIAAERRAVGRERDRETTRRAPAPTPPVTTPPVPA